MRQQTPAGLEAVLAPKSVAVVGASDRPGSVGRQVMEAALAGGFKGRLWAVNPKADAVLGVPAYPSVEELPEVPELAVLIVPSKVVLDVAEQCGRIGVKGLLVISAGFREAGGEGVELEERLEAIVEEHGMRMVGPNCVGVLNTDAGFDTVFAEHNVRPGKTAIMSQSGAVGVGLLHMADHSGLGVSRFVSLGNKTDVSGNDLLMLWEDDPDVKQVVFYLEGFGNPRNFVQIARRIATKKPVLVVKSGRSSAGSRAAASHTGALADSDRTVDAMLRQCGILRFDTVQSLFDAALAFEKDMVLRGDRIAVVTNSGGPAIMATDALIARGLRLAQLSERTRDALAEQLPPAAAFNNPVDTLAGADHRSFPQVVETVLQDEEVDAVLVIHTSVFGDQHHMVEPLGELRARHPNKPLLLVLYGSPADTLSHDFIDAGIPTFAFPEEAVDALAATHRWAWQADQGVDTPVDHPCDDGPCDGDGWLSQADALSFLAAHDLPVVPHAMVSTLEEARREAAAIGYPVVLKADRTDVVHKSDAGLVVTAIKDDAGLEVAWKQVTQGASKKTLRGVLVMQHARLGLELLLGAVQDPRYGPLIAFGLGGTQAEALQDVSFRLAPMGRQDVDGLVGDLRAQPLLGPFRGQPARDLEALKDCLLRLASLAWHHPEVAELDINPILLYGEGAAIVDARVRVVKE